MSEDPELMAKRVEDLAAKARRYATSDPEVSLSTARKVAEAMCRIAFQREIGEPGKIMLDAMLQKLVANKIIPASIQVPFGTLQAYGNYGAHAQSDARVVDTQYVAPAMAALAQVEAWFFDEYLKRPRNNADVSPRLPRAVRRRPIALAIVLLAAVTGGVIVLVALAHSAQGPSAPNGRVAAVPTVRADAMAAAADAPATSVDAPLPSEMKRAGDLALHYRIVARAPGADAFRMVQPNDPLTTDTRVSIQVEVSTSAYVFVVQRTHASKEIAVLFPDLRIQITNPIPKDTWIELPPSGKGYRLNDKDLGTETIYLIASSHPLPDLARAIAAPTATKDSGAVASQIVAISTDGTDCERARALTLDDSSDCLERPRGLVADEESVTGAQSPATATKATEPARVVRAKKNDDIVLVPFSFRHLPK